MTGQGICAAKICVADCSLKALRQTFKLLNIIKIFLYFSLNPEHLKDQLNLFSDEFSLSDKLSHKM